MWERLESLVGKQISLETHDGCLRNGTLTGIEWSAVEVDGEVLRVPAALRLDGEPGDAIPWRRLRHVRPREHG